VDDEVLAADQGDGGDAAGDRQEPGDQEQDVQAIDEVDPGGEGAGGGGGHAELVRLLKEALPIVTAMEGGA
jgi:hypothetical protein